MASIKLKGVDLGTSTEGCFQFIPKDKNMDYYTEENKDVYFAIIDSGQESKDGETLYTVDKMHKIEGSSGIHRESIKDYKDVEEYLRVNHPTEKKVYVMKCVKVVQLEVKDV